MSQKIQHPSPEFLINCSKVCGVPLGRLYIPCPGTIEPEFRQLLESVHIYEEKTYANGAKLMWFLAPMSDYRRLAERYPHSHYSDYTQRLLKAASTFFISFKPSYSSH
jgi:hypothetical protein